MMNKTDVEVLIYWLLKKHGLLPTNLNDASIKLKITKSRVQSLDYQASLRYGQNDTNDLRKEILNIITNAEFTTDKTGVKFSVENKLLRNVITAELNKLNCFNDTSFNRDIISIDFEFFAIFIDQYLFPDASNKKEKENLETKIAQLFEKQFKNMNDNPSQQTKFVQVIAYLLKSVSEGAFKGLTSGSIFSYFGSLVNLYDFVKKLF